MLGQYISVINSLDKVKMGEYLTAEQIEKFQKDGILVVENFLSQDEVKNMREEIMKLVVWTVNFAVFPKATFIL